MWRWIMAAVMGLVALCVLRASVLAGSLDIGDAAALGSLDSTAETQISAKADELDYDREKGVLEARGHVVIRRGTDELRADYVRVDMKTHDAIAVGNVVLVRPKATWRGDNLAYNFKTRVASCDRFRVDFSPFQVEAKAMPTAAADRYTIEDAFVTTCTNPMAHAHYKVRASRLDLVPGSYFEAHGALVYLGDVPVFYLPYWYRNLREDIGYRFYPGYSSKMGAFLLNTVRYRINPILRGETSLDLRSRRGLAGGQAFKWNDPEGAWLGEVRGYYAEDQEPMDENDDPALENISSGRYRFFLKHGASFSANDYILVQSEYVSDRDFREDFFEDEFRESRQPDNYAVYTWRDDAFAFNALVRGRLNDFYPAVQRLPELSFEFARQQIMDLPFYYEGATAAAFLDRVEPKEPEPDPANEYSAFRFDSAHMVYYPGHYFDFLSLIPRAGYRATFYSKTRGQETALVTRTGTVTNYQVDASGHTNMFETPFTETLTVTNDVEAGAKLRNRFEVGLEASYRAFSVWDAGGVPMRHVIEPYANYTLVPEPNLDENAIYKFDEVDKLGEEHKLRLGARNKWQVKDQDRARDLADADVYTTLRFHRPEGEALIRDISAEGELTPVSGVYVRFDGTLNVDAGGVDVFNVRTELKPDEWIHFTGEYRFRKDDFSQVSADCTISPNHEWAFNGYGRYSIEESRLEEVGGYAQKSLDCLAFRLGAGFLPGYTTTAGAQRDDEVRVIFGMWLTAFPHGKLLGRYTQ